MTNINRQAAGAKQAGVSVGGQFAASHKTEASGAGLAGSDVPPAQYEYDADTERLIMAARLIRTGDYVEVGSGDDWDGDVHKVTGVLHNPDGSVTLALDTGSGSTLSADAPVRAADPFAEIRPDDFGEGTPYSEGEPADWTGQELGLEGIYVAQVTAHGDHQQGEGSLTATVHEDPVSAGNLTAHQMQRGGQLVADTLTRKYDADVQLLDDTLHMDFTADLRGEPAVTEEFASDVIWNHTQAVKFANETDRGTYGSPYVYEEIAREIDRGFFPGTGGEVFDAGMRDRMQDIASFATYTRRDFPQLAMLAERGYCTDARAARKELLEADREVGEVQDTRDLRTMLNAEISRQEK
ncbi:hypothetical protein ACXR2T_09935 [Leucobacter sp. HY1910]